MLCLFAMFNSLNAQTTELILGGNTNDISPDMPSNEYFAYSVVQQIYTTEELGGEPSVITSIAFRKGSTQSTVERNYDVYIVNTNKTSFNNNYDWLTVSSSDKVFSGTVSYPSSMNEWLTIELQKPFTYTGGNILLCINDRTGNYANNYTQFYVYSSGDNKAMYRSNDGSMYNPEDESSITWVYGYFSQFVNTIKFTMAGSGEVIVEGDTKENAFEVETLPYENVVDNDYFDLLSNDYFTGNDALKDIVYKMQFPESVHITATTTAGELKIFTDEDEELTPVNGKYRLQANEIYYLIVGAPEAFTVNIAEYITEGDTWQNAVDVTEYPFVHTPAFADLNDNYDLPGTAADGPDAVYRLNLTEETTISASVTGTNGKIALYAAGFYGEDGPGIENLYVEPETTFFYDFETDCLATDFVIFDNDDNETITDNDGNSVAAFDQFMYDAENKNIVSYSYAEYPHYKALSPDNYIHTKYKYLITENSQISYNVIISSKYYNEQYSLIISEDGVNFDSYNTTVTNADRQDFFYFAGTKYVGKSVYIGFRHFQSWDGSSIHFDNFRLSDGSKDAAQKSGSNTLEHTLPAGTYYIAASATEAFTVNIDNAFIAQVDDAKYESMEDAVNAATAGQTVTLLKDAEGPAFNVNKSITIDFNNKTYTINNPVNISAGTLTLINGTFAGQDGFKNLVNITGGAQLVHNTAITGTITKSVEGTNQGWGTISTPVGNVSHANVTGLLSGKPELYLYDEANEYWRYYSDTENPEDVAQPFTSLEAGRGYLYANENNTDVVFEGTFGVSSVNFDLSCASEGQLRGFNMIGNPFTHDVNEVNFSTSGGASLSDGFYVITGGGAWTAKTNDTYIAPMESALVKTNMATTLTISNAPTSKSRGESKGYLKIDVSNSNYSDVAYVSFDSGLGLDKIAHRNAEIPMVYVPVDGVNYAIAKMDESVTEVPVSFKAMTMGEYTISAKALGCEYEQITLVDKMTGVMTNMLLEDYTFIARTTDKSERFLIKLVAKEDAEDTEHFAYINNGALVINSIKGEGRVRIFDVMGRSVAEYEVSGSANIPVVSLRSGVYLVHKSDENGVKVQKVVID